jgi:hypothetical protein
LRTDKGLKRAIIFLHANMYVMSLGAEDTHTLPEVRLSLQSSSKSISSTMPTLTFNPSISFEMVTLNMIDRIMASPMFLTPEADPTKAHALAKEMVTYFDKWVSSILKVDDTRDFSDYTKRREKIISDWNKAQKSNDKVEALNCAHDLFGLTVEILAQQRLFRIRRFSHFIMNQPRDSSKITQTDLKNAEEEYGDDT